MARSDNFIFYSSFYWAYFILFLEHLVQRTNQIKTMAADWTNALGFAIVAASIIRSLFFEVYNTYWFHGENYENWRLFIC